jgi:choline dehydrogenase-like flavoprotein
MYDDIIGSGFEGRISALRLAKTGYSFLVLEKAGRYGDNDSAIGDDHRAGGRRHE